MRKMLAGMMVCVLLLMSGIGAFAESAEPMNNWSYIAVNDQQAVQACKESAESGDAEAMFRLAQMYFVGGDITLAKEWYGKAADAGYMEAKNVLRSMELFELGSQEIAKGKIEPSVPYMLDAAQLGNVMAMMNVAMFYMQGIGVEQSDEMAFEWYRKAAQAGVPDALEMVGLMYRDGYCTKHNLEQAEEYLRRAVEAGHVQSAIHLAELYESGFPDEEAAGKVYDL